ncbi:MAG: peptidase M48 [Moraxellaceae bacterium]|nr:MAG: peptidase M48 [Moraxellaceae bacterium]
MNLLFQVQTIIRHAAKRQRTAIARFCLLSIFITPVLSFASSSGLPQLGDSTSGIISPEKEKALGKAWLRQLRGQAPTISDPLLYSYTEHLLYLLASNSELIEPQIKLVIINSSQINAFAVPGGVIGINAGLLLHAQTEDELAAVMAHEIAHLSQRHFARGLDFSQKSNWTNLAALLASVAILATSGGDAGIAALAATQASAIDNQLRFSRHNEREADRIGVQTLIRAGLSPHAMPDFFEKLLRSARYSGEQPPAFLLSHPVTQERITDSRNRVQHLPQQNSSQNLTFYLMKMRTSVEYSRDKAASIKELEANLIQQSTSNSEVTRYGLANTLQESGSFNKALAHINILLKKRPENLVYLTTKAEILNDAGRYKEAQAASESALKITPNNFPLSIALAESLIRSNLPIEAIKILKGQLASKPNTPFLWYKLSEAYGKQKNIAGVHQSRAEYLFLVGRTDKSLEQLRYAIAASIGNFNLQSKLKKRVEQIKASRKDLEL